MMRSSPSVACADGSPVPRTVGTGPARVNSNLTDLSTKAERLWDRYRYPDWLAVHSRVVGRIAEALVAGLRPGRQPLEAGPIILGAYLHDIGRSPLLAGDERDHNILSGLVLAAEGEGACVELARRHAIYTVLDPDLAPRTAEEKLVYVADRRGGQSVETLEARAQDTARRNPRYAAEIARAIPLAKAMEREVFADIAFGPDELAEKAR